MKDLKKPCKPRKPRALTKPGPYFPREYVFSVYLPNKQTTVVTEEELAKELAQVLSEQIIKHKKKIIAWGHKPINFSLKRYNTHMAICYDILNSEYDKQLASYNAKLILHLEKEKLYDQEMEFYTEAMIKYNKEKTILMAQELEREHQTFVNSCVEKIKNCEIDIMSFSQKLQQEIRAIL